MSPLWANGPEVSVFAVAHRSAVLSVLEDFGFSIKAYVSSNHEWLPIVEQYSGCSPS
jgi:hypothetical protein